MRRLVNNIGTKFAMDQSDIKYIIELFDDAISEKDWDKLEEVRETIKEFLDVDELNEEEQ